MDSPSCGAPIPAYAVCGVCIEQLFQLQYSTVLDHTPLSVALPAPVELRSLRSLAYATRPTTVDDRTRSYHSCHIDANSRGVTQSRSLPYATRSTVIFFIGDGDHTPLPVTLYSALLSRDPYMITQSPEFVLCNPIDCYFGRVLDPTAELLCRIKTL